MSNPTETAGPPYFPVQLIDSVGAVWNLGDQGWSTVDCDGVAGRPYLTNRDFATVRKIHGPVRVTKYGPVPA